MKRDDVFPSKWLKASDLNGPCRAIIGRVENDRIGDDTKPVAYFSRAQQDVVKEKGLVLNATNWDVIAGMHGEDSDSWHGCEITLYATTVMFGGKKTPCIRVDDRPSAMTAAKPAYASGLPDNGQAKPAFNERNPPPTTRIPPHIKSGTLEDEMNDEVPW